MNKKSRNNDVISNNILEENTDDIQQNIQKTLNELIAIDSDEELTEITGYNEYDFESKRKKFNIYI